VVERSPRVARYVVIDDENDELDELPLFQPSATTGLTDKIIKGVVDYLDGKQTRTRGVVALLES
jgi:hypothetical protein